MAEQQILNATMAMTSFASASSIGWLATVIVFIMTIVILVLVFRNLRRIIYGSIVSGIIIGIYHFSRWIGVSTQNKDYVPVSWFIYIIGFIFISWLIGLWLDKNKVIKKFESNFDDATPLIKEIRKNKQ